MSRLQRLKDVLDYHRERLVDLEKEYNHKEKTESYRKHRVQINASILDFANQIEMYGCDGSIIIITGRGYINSVFYHSEAYFANVTEEEAKHLFKLDNPSMDITDIKLLKSRRTILKPVKFGK